MAAPLPLIGRLCKVRIQGVPIQANEWNVEPQVDTIDVSNFEGSVTGTGLGYKDYVNGLRGAQVTVNAWFNNAVNYFDLGIIDGNIVTNVYLYTKDIGSPAWYFPVMLVKQVSANAKVMDILRLTIVMMNKGEYAYPSGVVA